MNLPDNIKYTNEHEWVSVERNTAKIGITDYAQGELGDVVFIDIDQSLSEVGKGDSIGTIEAVKTVSDIYAPLSGKIKEINPVLTDTPEIVNSDPYSEGWIVKIEISDESELNDLLDVAAYKELIGQ